MEMEKKYINKEKADEVTKEQEKNKFVSKIFNENLLEYEKRLGKESILYLDRKRTIAIVNKATKVQFDGKERNCYQILIGRVSISVNPDTSFYGDGCDKPSVWLDNEYIEFVWGDKDGYGKFSAYSPSELVNLKAHRDKWNKLKELFGELIGSDE